MWQGAWSCSFADAEANRRARDATAWCLLSFLQIKYYGQTAGYFASVYFASTSKIDCSRP
eukprot:3271620-Pleurochrysis_carterae.AAC.1